MNPASLHISPRPTRQSRGSKVILVLAGLLVLTGFASVTLGLVSVSVADLWSAGPEKLVTQLRLSRFLVAACVGAGLAIAGLLMQIVLRNPLVEPGILGLNAGAALAAASVLLFSSGAVSQWGLSAAAVSGAICIMTVVLALGWSPGQAVGGRFILAGIAASALCGAILKALTLSSPPDRLPRLLAWLSGDLNGMTLTQAGALGAVLLGLCIALAPMARLLDALALDRRTAAGIGLHGRLMFFGPLLLAATIAGVATSIVGIVAFVGLVAPHLARKLTGPKNVWAIPTVMLTGAILVALADLAGRLILEPDQIPAGLITALIGAPWFFVLMARQNV